MADKGIIFYSTIFKVLTLTNLLCVQICLAFKHSDLVPSQEKTLSRVLMANYTSIGINGRPILNISHAVSVEFGLGLIQMDLDEKNKILSTSVWSRYKWRDEYLRWKPEEHGGLAQLKFMPDQIWRPDVMLYNTADTEKSERSVLAVVSHDGTVLWVPHQIFRSSCSIDVSNFPFDYQKCSMWFGSWTYGLKDLDLRLAFDSGIDLSTFMTDNKESCTWEIVNNTAERKELPEEAPTYVVLTFTLGLKRKMVFSTYILTLPCVFLASLTLVVFWLPPERPDRTGLAMSIFASFLVLLLILVEAAPPTASSVPTLGVYYCFNMVLIMTSLFFSTFVVNIDRYGRNNKPVPKWLRFVMFEIVGRMFCLGVHDMSMTCIRKSTSSTQLLKDREANIPPSRMDGVSLRPRLCDLSDTKSTEDISSVMSESMRAEVTELKNTLSAMTHYIANNVASDDYNKRIVRDWHSVAKALDRLFFFLYLLAIIFSLIAFFPRPALEYSLLPL